LPYHFCGFFLHAEKVTSWLAPSGLRKNVNIYMVRCYGVFQTINRLMRSIPYSLILTFLCGALLQCSSNYESYEARTQQAGEKTEEIKNNTASASRKTVLSTAAEEAKRKAEEDAKREAEEDARLKAEEEAKREAEEEAKREAEEEAKREAEEEAKREAEEEAKREAEEEAKREAEEDARLKAEKDARLNAEEDAKLKAEEDARLKAEEDARLNAEEDARLKAEEDAKLNAEEDARLNAEEDAKLNAEEDAKLNAEEDAKQKKEASRTPDFNRLKHRKSQLRTPDRAIRSEAFRLLGRSPDSPYEEKTPPYTPTREQAEEILERSEKSNLSK
jgi:membrane protein involved in colicin uptake